MTHENHSGMLEAGGHGYSEPGATQQDLGHEKQECKKTLLQPGTLLQPAHAPASHPLGKGRGQRRVRHPELRNQSELPGTRHPRPSVPPQPYPAHGEIASSIRLDLNPYRDKPCLNPPCPSRWPIRFLKP